MSEIDFDERGIREFISETVPSYNQKIALSSLELEESELEDLGLKLTGESSTKSFVINTGSGIKSDKSLWVCIKNEVHDYFCTKSAKYRAERNKAEVTFKNILMILATAIAAQFNLAIGVVAGAVTVAVISVFKIGKNAWCEANAPK